MTRTIRAPRGTQLTCKNWLIEAAYRMLQNNLDPEVAVDPDNLIVYGGRGKAARNWESFDAILRSLRNAGAGRDAAGAVGQAGGRLPHPRGRAARADRQLQHRARLGHAGELRPLGARGPDHVRPDDRRLLDLHRHPGHPAGHLRDLRQPGPPARLGARPAGASSSLTAGLGEMGGAQPLAVTMNEGVGPGRRGRPAGAPSAGCSTATWIVAHRRPGRGDDLGRGGGGSAASPRPSA